MLKLKATYFLPLAMFWIAGCSSGVSIFNARQNSSAIATDRSGGNTETRKAECTYDDAQKAWIFPNESVLEQLNLLSEDFVVAGAPLIDLSKTFQLHSNPTAKKVIYLDFNGYVCQSCGWNVDGLKTFTSPPFSLDADTNSFSTAERTLIQRVFQRVAADYAVFDVDVTTQEPPLDRLTFQGGGVADDTWGVRVVFTSYGPGYKIAGGISGGAFRSSVDQPVFVYNKNMTSAAEAASHEAGHKLGLSHDGRMVGTTASAYYYGHGSGETGWAPIMGVGYNQNVTTWDDSSYNGAYNSQHGGKDDILLIQKNGGFGLRTDIEGNTLATATPLTIKGGAVSRFGRIETRGDLDIFSFTLATDSSIDLTISPYWYKAFISSALAWGGTFSEYFAPVSDENTSTAYADHGANLDVGVRLMNSDGVVIAEASDPTRLSARLVVANLPPGKFFLEVNGVGVGTPTASAPSGYSDYASIGNYLISGTVLEKKLAASGPQVLVK